jgi:hypothetical protein
MQYILPSKGCKIVETVVAMRKAMSECLIERRLCAASCVLIETRQSGTYEKKVRITSSLNELRPYCEFCERVARPPQLLMIGVLTWERKSREAYVASRLDECLRHPSPRRLNRGSCPGARAAPGGLSRVPYATSSATFHREDLENSASSM